MPMDASAGFSGDPVLISTLIISLGETTPDAFYFACAYASFDTIKAFAPTEEEARQLYTLGLKAAYIARRADVASLVIERGADVDSFIATMGLVDAQAFVTKGHGERMLAQDVSPQLKTFIASETTPREHNTLRVRWLDLRPRNLIALLAVQGVDRPRRPGILHYLALEAWDFTPDQRLAWMQFDLERGADINGYAFDGYNSGAPLHWVFNDNSPVWENRGVLMFLLEHGANPLNTCPGEPYTNVTPRGYIDSFQLSMHCQEMQDFYKFAVAELSKQERAWAARTSVLGRVMNALGLSSS